MTAAAVPAPSDQAASAVTVSPATLSRSGSMIDGAIEARIKVFADDEYVRVVAAVSLFCGSDTDGADAVVDALGRAWERMATGTSIDNLAAWVTTAAMNQIRSRHRHLSVDRRSRHLVARSESVDAADTTVTRIDVARAISALSDRQRHILALRYGLDAPVRDIATELGIAEGTVKATLHQTRSILADRLGESFRGGLDD